MDQAGFKVVVALFRDYSKAQRAVEALLNVGVEQQDISLIRRDGAGKTGGLGNNERSATQTRGGDYRPEVAPGDDDLDAGSGAVIGGATGAVVGGALGALLAGIGGLVIPGVGALLGVGPLAATVISGIGVGTVTGGVAGALVNAGVPEDQAEYYQEGVRRGGTLLTVHTSAARAEGISRILMEYGPLEVERKEDVQMGDASRRLEEAGLGVSSREVEAVDVPHVETERMTAMPNKPVDERNPAGDLSMVGAARKDLTNAGTEEVAGSGEQMSEARKQNPDAPPTPEHKGQAGKVDDRSKSPDHAAMDGGVHDSRNVLGSEGNTR